MKMLCQIGGFSWDTDLEGECPNHGLNDRWGNPRRTGAFCGDEGPEDRTGIPILGCCSLPKGSTLREIARAYLLVSHVKQIRIARDLGVYDGNGVGWRGERAGVFKAIKNRGLVSDLAEALGLAYDGC